MVISGFVLLPYAAAGAPLFGIGASATVDNLPADLSLVPDLGRRRWLWRKSCLPAGCFTAPKRGEVNS